MAAGKSPIKTLAAWSGAGRFDIEVPAGGAEPVAIVGDTAPWPVMYIVITCPRAAVFAGTNAPEASVNTPGAADAIGKDLDVACPLLLTTTVAVEFTGVSYGI